MKVEGSRPHDNQEVQLRAQKSGKQETTPGISENPQADQQIRSGPSLGKSQRVGRVKAGYPIKCRRYGRIRLRP